VWDALLAEAEAEVEGDAGGGAGALPSQLKTGGPVVHRMSFGIIAAKRDLEFTRDGVVVELLVDVNLDTRVGAAIGTWEADRSWLSAASSSNLQLSTLHLQAI
jgi:hypothetical protein